MNAKAMWFHHLSIVWNVISTVFVVGFIAVWFWYGLKLEIGKEGDIFHFFYQSKPLRDNVRDIKDTFFSDVSPWAIYSQKADEVRRELNAEREKGTLTEARKDYYVHRLNELWDTYQQSDQYRTGKSYPSDTTTPRKAN